MDTPSRISARYSFDASEGRAQEFARFISREQTVEVPEDLVVSSGIGQEFLGRVDDLQPVSEQTDRWIATISYDARLAAGHLPQLLNLLFGILSCHPRVRLEEFELPEDVQRRFPGPRHGIGGIREILGVDSRPLLSTALKPKGVSVEDLVALARGFALGGGDILKDDHNLADESTEAFRERVLRIHEAVERCNALAGSRTLYFPVVSAPWPEVEKRLSLLVAEEIPGVLLPPFLLGLDTTRWLTTQFPLITMSHPTLGGVFFSHAAGGVAHHLVLGRWMRMVGMDISIFANAGGRYPVERDQGVALAQELRSESPAWRPSFPAPAGGMTFEHIPEIVGDYGRDVILLIGGALLSHSQDLAASTRLFRERLETA